MCDFPSLHTVHAFCSVFFIAHAQFLAAENVCARFSRAQLAHMAAVQATPAAWAAPARQAALALGAGAAVWAASAANSQGREKIENEISPNMVAARSPLFHFLEF